MSARCSRPTPQASRRWARSRAPVTRRSTTAAGIRRASAARPARPSPRRGCSGSTASARSPRWALALLRAGGLRAAFGSDGKALQVGLASAAGVQAARLAAAGARVDAAAIAGGRAGFAQAFGVGDGRGHLDALLEAGGAIGENWIKAYPCCLQTHARDRRGARRSGRGARRSGARITVAVHPLSRQAAALDAVRDGLEAKFSIPYLTAYALLHGAPDSRRSPASTPPRRRSGRASPCAPTPRWRPTRRCSSSTASSPRASLAPRGCPAEPLDDAALAAKVRALAGTALDGALDDPRRPAAELVALVAAPRAA